MEDLKLISYTVEYKNELREQNVLAIFKHNGYYFSIRVFNLENIEFAFYEKLSDINNSSYKEKFIISIFQKIRFKNLIILFFLSSIIILLLSFI